MSFYDVALIAGAFVNEHLPTEGFTSSASADNCSLTGCSYTRLTLSYSYDKEDNTFSRSLNIGFAGEDTRTDFTLTVSLTPGSRDIKVCIDASDSLLDDSTGADFSFLGGFLLNSYGRIKGVGKLS